MKWPSLMAKKEKKYALTNKEKTFCRIDSCFKLKRRVNLVTRKVLSN